MIDTERCAYHEAGHAVVACLFRLPLQRVTIKPWRSRRGETKLRRLTWTWADAPVRIQMRSGGFAAECIHFGEDPETMDASLAFADTIENVFLAKSF